jgi:hypothetical protein
MANVTRGTERHMNETSRDCRELVPDRNALAKKPIDDSTALHCMETTGHAASDIELPVCHDVS